MPQHQEGIFVTLRMQAGPHAGYSVMHVSGGGSRGGPGVGPWAGRGARECHNLPAPREAPAECWGAGCC